MLKNINIFILLFCAFLFTFKTHASEKHEEVFNIFPVGEIEKKGDSTFIRIYPKYSNALEGLDGFSHIIVIYWFHKNDTPDKRRILQVHPRWNRRNPLTGVFACRAPVRPNLTALTVCRILSIRENIIRLDKIDAFDKSPIIDIKPYIPSIDKPSENVSVPEWLTNS